MDGIADGRGRELFAFLCGVHDVGKATPLFQGRIPALGSAVQASGLTWGRISASNSAWHHSRASAAILRKVAGEAGWRRDAVDWTWPILAGHHGRVPPVALVKPPSDTDDHGRTREWDAAQTRLVELVAGAAGFASVGDAAPTGTPSRGDQLTFAGLLIMADWLASNEIVFPPVSNPMQVGMELARRRAPRAWRALSLGNGWAARPANGVDLVADRFGVQPRPVQQATVGLASDVPGSGLLVIEAPMGEGKTEAALGAAEVLAARFGMHGLFVGMPTQATSDPMFERVLSWAASAAIDSNVALLHGKRMFNPQWRAIVARLHLGPIDDESSPHEEGSHLPEHANAAEWFLGPKRGLLTPIAVGTIDNLLLAATRTPFAMLRHAGLATKVVVLDEVHAASVYMAQYLFEALRWLGSAQAPVILLTATLPPAMRKALARAYLEGAFQAAGRRDPDLDAEAAVGAMDEASYPSVRAVGVAGGRPWSRLARSSAWRPSRLVRIESIEPLDEDGTAIAAVLGDSLEEGGCAVVIRNTVSLAQRTFSTLRERFGDDVALLHGRLIVGERASRTERELALLGRGTDRRPHRHILVATQVAEQSFDVDADLLVTDLAPVDLLLQRIGRLHRHERSWRPPRLREPRVLVCGWERPAGSAPRFALGSRAIYRDHRLLRTAALVEPALDRGWLIPDEVPRLVAAVYGDEVLVPSGWSAAAELAELEEQRYLRGLVADAERGLLSVRGSFAARTLAGLHNLGYELADEEASAGVVREGQQAAEVVLVRTRDGGDLATLGGRPLVVDGKFVDDEAGVDEALASLVRLPARMRRAGRDVAGPEPWGRHPLLGLYHPLALGEDGRASIAGQVVRYDHLLGLVLE